MSRGSFRDPEKSSRSKAVVDGMTMSAWRAIGVQYGSCTTTVSTRPRARLSRGRFWWW